MQTGAGTSVVSSPAVPETSEVFQVSNHGPHVVDAADTEVQVTPAKMATARIISSQVCGSQLLFGLTWLDPRSESGPFAFFDPDVEPEDAPNYGPVDETFYVVSGRLRATWDGGEVEAEPGQVLHLPPGNTYRLSNPSDERMEAVYALAPTPV